MALEHPADAEAIELRHDEVQQDEVRGSPPDLFEGFQAVGRRDDAVAGSPEALPDGFPKEGVVIDDEDCLGHVTDPRGLALVLACVRQADDAEAGRDHPRSLCSQNLSRRVGKVEDSPFRERPTVVDPDLCGPTILQVLHGDPCPDGKGSVRRGHPPLVVDLPARGSRPMVRAAVPRGVAGLLVAHEDRMENRKPT